MANLDLFDYTKSWTLNKYSKYINNSVSYQQQPTSSRNVHSDSWKTVESSQYITPLTLSITPTNFLMIKNDSEIQEFVNLWTSKSSLKGVYKGDSLMVIQKMRDFIRKFRVQFTRTKFKSGEENCSSCVKELSRFFPVQEFSASNQTTASQSNFSQQSTSHYGFTQPSSQLQITQNRAISSSQAFIKPGSKSDKAPSSIELNDLTRVLLEKNEHKLPLFYKSCDEAGNQEKDDAMKEFIVSCLLDPKFSAFVKKVETFVTDMITDNHQLGK